MMSASENPIPDEPPKKYKYPSDRWVSLLIGLGPGLFLFGTMWGCQCPVPCAACIGVGTAILIYAIAIACFADSARERERRA